MNRKILNIALILIVLSGAGIDLFAADTLTAEQGRRVIKGPFTYNSYENSLRIRLASGYTDDAIKAEQDGDGFTALQYFQVSYDYYPNPQTAANLGYLFMELAESGVQDKQKYLDSAKHYFDSGFLMDSSDIQILKGLGLFYTRTGDKANEFTTAQRIANVEPSEYIYTHLADLYYEKGDYPSVEKYLKKCMDISGKGIYYLKLSTIYDEQGKHDLAFEAKKSYLMSKDLNNEGMKWWFYKVLQKNEIGMLLNNLDRLEKVCEAKTLNMLFVNILWFNEKDTTVAPQNYREALRLMETSSLDAKTRNVINSNLYLQLGKNDSAIIEINKSNDYDSFLRSRALEAFLNFHCDNAALKIATDNPDSVFCSGTAMLQNLINLLSLHSETKTSIKVLENYISTTDTLYCFYYAVLSELSAEVKERTKALTYMEKAHTCSPENLDFANTYSYYLAIQGKDLPLALNLIEPCIEKAPLNSFYLDTYAWVKYKLGDIESAVKNINKALAIEKNSSDIWFHRGCIYYKMGQISDALESWEKAEAIAKKANVKKK